MHLTNHLSDRSISPPRSLSSVSARRLASKRVRLTEMRMLWLVCAASIVCSATGSICYDELVLLSFSTSNVANDNFAGQDAASEAAGLAQTIRVSPAGTYNGRQIDVVMDSPASAGAAGRCLASGGCDFAVNSHDVAQFKVRSHIDNAFDVRWTFEYTDGSGVAVLPKVAVTWLDLGSREFVAVEQGSFDSFSLSGSEPLD